MQKQVETVAPERNRMESDFQKYALDSDDTTDTQNPQTAPIVDFEVQDNTDFFGAVEITLYAHAGIGLVSYTFRHTRTSPSETLWELLEQTPTGALEETFDIELFLVPTEDGWYNKEYDITFTEDNPPKDSSDRRYADTKLFNELDAGIREAYHEKQNRTTSGYATIVDYNVRRSASEITQKLEIDIKFRLPDGQTKWYKCIHDVDHLDEGFERLRNAAGNPENVYELMGVKIYTKWDDENCRWLMFPPKHSSKTLHKLFTKFNIRPIFRGKSFAITKTYKHADD